MRELIRSIAGALLVSTLAACSPRIDRVDVFNGPRDSRPGPPATPTTSAPLTIRAEISPRQTTLLTPTVTLRPLEQASTGAADVSATTLTLTSEAPGSSAAYTITIAPGGQPPLPYGSSWRMDLQVPYRSLGRSGVLHEQRDFTVRAPASCAAFDNGIEGWSIPENRIGYGASFDDMSRWPQDTQTRFLTTVSLEPDTSENFPRSFTAPGVPFGSARFTIGGDHPEKFREWLVRNPYINQRNHWIAKLETSSLLSNAVSLQLKTDAAHPLQLRARAYCTIPGTNNVPCNPEQADSADAHVKPGSGWQSIQLSVDPKAFPERSAAGIGHLLIFGDAADSEKRVWIDMVCPEPLR